MQLRLSVNIYTLVPQFLEVKLVKEDPSSEAGGVAAPPSRGRGQQKNIEQEILKNLIL